MATTPAVCSCDPSLAVEEGATIDCTDAECNSYLIGSLVSHAVGSIIATGMLVYVLAFGKNPKYFLPRATYCVLLVLVTLLRTVRYLFIWQDIVSFSASVANLLFALPSGMILAVLCLQGYLWTSSMWDLMQLATGTPEQLRRRKGIVLGISMFAVALLGVFFATYFPVTTDGALSASGNIALVQIVIGASTFLVGLIFGLWSFYTWILVRSSSGVPKPFKAVTSAALWNMFFATLSVLLGGLLPTLLGIEPGDQLTAQLVLRLIEVVAVVLACFYLYRASLSPGLKRLVAVSDDEEEEEDYEEDSDEEESDEEEEMDNDEAMAIIQFQQMQLQKAQQMLKAQQALLAPKKKDTGIETCWVCGEPLGDTGHAPGACPRASANIGEDFSDLISLGSAWGGASEAGNRSSMSSVMTLNSTSIKSLDTINSAAKRAKKKKKEWRASQAAPTWSGDSLDEPLELSSAAKEEVTGRPASVQSKSSQQRKNSQGKQSNRKPSSEPAGSGSGAGGRRDSSPSKSNRSSSRGGGSGKSRRRRTASQDRLKQQGKQRAGGPSAKNANDLDQFR